MSLKAFHLLFIVLAIVLSGGFAAWCLVAYFSEHASSMLALAAGALLACAGLIAYAVHARRKLKDFGWI